MPTTRGLAVSSPTGTAEKNRRPATVKEAVAVVVISVSATPRAAGDNPSDLLGASEEVTDSD